MIRYTLFSFIILILSCRNTDNHADLTPASPLTLSDTIRILLNDNIRYISDSLWKRDPALLDQYIRKYLPDSCCVIRFENEHLKNDYEGPGLPGDINGDRRPDTFYILKEFHLCAQGQSYLFADTSLPRLTTTSFCCHPRNLFLIGDIDEDGIQEIGLYHSSCSSHYKSLYAYSIKKGAWKEVGHTIFDTYYMDTEKPYQHFFRKTGKGRFEMLETTDLREANIGKPIWQKFTIGTENTNLQP